MPLRERDVAELAGRIFREVVNKQRDSQRNETFTDAFLRVVGLLRFDVNEPEVNLVGGLLKYKDLSTKQVVERSLAVFIAFRDQLLQMSFDRLTTKIVRLERLLGSQPLVEVVAAQQVNTSGDLATADNETRRALSALRLNTDSQGTLTDELILLGLLLNKTQNVVLRLPVERMGNDSGLFIDLIRAPTLDIEERYSALQERYRALSAELVRLRQQRDLVVSGVTVDQQQSISLLKTIDLFLFIMRDVQYNCGQCIYFVNDQCTYASSNRDTNTTQSCVEVWGLISNDFWTANESVLQSARDILQGI